MVNEGHDDADETTGDIGEIVDVVPLVVIGLDRQRVGDDCKREDFLLRIVGETGDDVEHFVSLVVVKVILMSLGEVPLDG